MKKPDLAAILKIRTDWLEGITLLSLAGWLCFRCWPVCLPALPIFLKAERQAAGEKCRLKRQREFVSAVTILYSSSAAGMPLETAFRDAATEMRRLPAQYSLILPEFEQICRRLDRNVPLHTALAEFDAHMADEDVHHFVEVLGIATSTGGSLSEVIRNYSEITAARYAVSAEIETMLAGRRGEMKVMLVVPAAILLYMNLTSAEYMSVLYTTLSGRLVMAAALALYTGGLLVGRKILAIRL